MGVAVWSSQASQPNHILQGFATLTVNDDMTPSLLHNKMCLEQVIELLLLRLLHLRAEHLLRARMQHGHLF